MTFLGLRASGCEGRARNGFVAVFRGTRFGSSGGFADHIGADFPALARELAGASTVSREACRRRRAIGMSVRALAVAAAGTAEVDVVTLFHKGRTLNADLGWAPAFS